MWSKGMVNGYVYCVKHFEQGSKYGIDGGRISKMSISKDNRLLFNYDRGLDIDCLDAEGKAVYAKLLKRYNEPQRQKSRAPAR